MVGQKVTHRRGPSWSPQELQIIDDNLDLTAEQLALLLPRRTPPGIAKKRAERHGRRSSRTADRGCWSLQDEAICRGWNAMFAGLNECRRTRKKEGV
jgi:hypothetical protein